jgi:uncharacterized protein (DUF305 family)
MSRIPLSLVAAALFGAALATAVGACATAPAGGPSQSMAGHSAGSMELHQIMAQGMAMPMPMSGDVDKDSATMITMHHPQANKMVDVLLDHGDNASLEALAQRMKSGQQKEITELAPYTK